MPNFSADEYFLDIGYNIHDLVVRIYLLLDFSWITPLYYYLTVKHIVSLSSMLELDNRNVNRH